MATFITEMEVADVELPKLDRIFKSVEKNVKSKIQKYYLTTCPKCKRETPLYWMKWSYVYRCPRCKECVTIKDLNKIDSGRFVCNNCAKKEGQVISESISAKKIDKEKIDKVIFEPTSAKKIEEIPYKMEIRCNCGYVGTRVPDSYDLDILKNIRRNFNSIVNVNKLWYPDDKFPDADLERDHALFQKGIKQFIDFFTYRNLLALSTLFKEIRKYSKTSEGKLLLLAFSDTLGWTSKMSSEPGHGWQHHAYWLPNLYYECNVWEYFSRRYDVMIRGKEYSKKEINGFYKKASTFQELNKNTCFMITGSSHQLPIPSGKVDAIITDPPYGGNVQYWELSLFYLVWLQKVLKIDPFQNVMQEAIETRHTGFNFEKSPDHYRRILLSIFKECHRVLRPNGWMVMTFHNRNFRVWNALHSVIHDAGFLLPEEDGMIYQMPIQNYTQTMHTRAMGSMLGDFLLSFKRLDSPPKTKMADNVEIGSKVRKIAAETVQYHGGAKLSTIYMRLIPFLLNNGLLHKMKEDDITLYLRNDFEERGGLWYFKENTVEVEGIGTLDYIPVEARIEYLILSVFHDKEKVTLDDILAAIFTNLINSNAAEYEEITKVLNKVAKLSNDERYWQLRDYMIRTQPTLMDWSEDREEIPQQVIDKSEVSLHDLAIERIVHVGQRSAAGSHIGETEQRKYVRFRKMSIPMGKNIYGIPDHTFYRIRDIDVLWIKDSSILSAFEVENSTTIDSGITRFRELFAATPSLNISAYIVVPDKRLKEAQMKIGSMANRKEGLNKKIRILKYSDIISKKEPDIEKLAIDVP